MTRILATSIAFLAMCGLIIYAIIGLEGIDKATKERDEHIRATFNERLPEGCKLYDLGMYPTPSRYIPVLLVRCKTSTTTMYRLQNAKSNVDVSVMDVE